MASMPFDPLALLIALAVLAVLGWFVWHIFSEVRATSAALLRFADRRAQNQRNAIDAGNAQGRGESNWLRAAQILSLFLLVCALAVAVLHKFGLV